MGSERTPAIERRYVSRRDVRRFALSIGALDPVHHDLAAAQAAGHVDLLAPAWFFSSLGLSFGRLVDRSRLGEEGLPLDDDLAGRRVLAGETVVEWSGDLEARTVVEVSQELASVTSKEGSRGMLEFYAYERTYAVDGRILVRESFTRIAR
ncbi:FAS1-like dehydratase domain-containing protein [Rhodococcoides fascians]|uniref:FAS1-like dehydratase domain-containing protein n=1 Tax=Rhodococcoides fascians TaxID=1828 RepID=UPI00068F1204|nr:MaoC family dehydratase N-terminal domain-containing protein [Rhodococcus fascians]